ncbi:hypothetical protein GCM10009092_01100 [Bowmanella denitrificans]|uniref:Uncharacterized protein n=1 Tax=Bowmanella denitrificans TaxID=366582 RepID=A0ABN0WKC6_9ALTE
MMKLKYSLMLSFFLSFSVVANSGWYEGKVGDLASGYDGSSVAFRLFELTAENPQIDYSKCTCNPSWNMLCLNPARANVNREFSMLLSAYSAGTNVKVALDTSCNIVAIILPVK